MAKVAVKFTYMKLHVVILFCICAGFYSCQKAYKLPAKLADTTTTKPKVPKDTVPSVKDTVTVPKDTIVNAAAYDTIFSQQALIDTLVKYLPHYYYQENVDSYTLLLDSVYMDGAKFDAFGSWLATSPNNWAIYLLKWDGTNASPDAEEYYLDGKYICGYFNQTFGVGNIILVIGDRKWLAYQVPVQADLKIESGRWLSPPKETIIYGSSTKTNGFAASSSHRQNLFDVWKDRHKDDKTSQH